MLTHAGIHTAAATTASRRCSGMCLLDRSGRGAVKTGTFHAPGAWWLSWIFACSGAGTAQHTIDVERRSGARGAVQAQRVTAGSYGKRHITRGGMYFLQISGVGCTWRVRADRKKVLSRPKPVATPTSSPTASPTPVATTAPTATVIPVTATPAPAHTGPKSYYLALGDSLAFGYQPNFDFQHGYVDDFFSYLTARGTSHLVNLACPGESTTTFINGGCPFSIIRKTSYAGSQLAAALDVIRQHPGDVSPVTLDIGADDFPSLTSADCTAIPDYTAQLATLDTNVRSILSQLRDALHGQGDLIVMNYYDPLQNACGDPALLGVVQTINGHLAADAAQYGAAVADVFGAFGGATTPNPHICDYTWICSSSHDIHATNAGYSVIAGAFERAAGY